VYCRLPRGFCVSSSVFNLTFGICGKNPVILEQFEGKVHGLALVDRPLLEVYCRLPRDCFASSTVPTLWYKSGNFGAHLRAKLSVSLSLIRHSCKLIAACREA